jgi:hypothetical protein
MYLRRRPQLCIGTMNSQSSTCERPQSSSDAGFALNEPDETVVQNVMDRREILKKALGLAAVGAVAGTIVAEAKAAPASASGGGTLQGAFGPAVVALTDAPTIAVDAAQGNDFRLTIAANRTMANPSNSVDGQQIIFQVTQGTNAPCTISWGSSYEFSAGVPQPTLSTAAGQTDLLGFIYNAAKGTWLLAAFVNGFD